MPTDIKTKKIAAAWWTGSGVRPAAHFGVLQRDHRARRVATTGTPMRGAQPGVAVTTIDSFPVCQPVMNVEMLTCSSG